MASVQRKDGEAVENVGWDKPHGALAYHLAGATSHRVGLRPERLVPPDLAEWFADFKGQRGSGWGAAAGQWSLPDQRNVQVVATHPRLGRLRESDLYVSCLEVHESPFDRRRDPLQQVVAALLHVDCTAQFVRIKHRDFSGTNHRTGSPVDGFTSSPD